jgi:hypothetical protein
MKRKLTIFPAPNESGYQLATRIAALAAKIGYECQLEENYTPRAGMQACFCDDVVVYDLTVTENEVGAYRALSPLYVFLDHVLIVSRTPLAMNLVPVRPGGAPPYPYPLTRLPDGSAVTFPAFTLSGEPRGEWVAEEDYSLLNWLQRQLQDLHQKPAGLRVPHEGSERPHWPLSRSVRRFLRQVTQEQEVYAGLPRDQSFLSYRGRYYNEVLRLADLISDSKVPDNGRRRLRIVSPAEFALERELLSAGHRWMILSYLRLLILFSGEFWVYQTNDYLTSWWTLGELVVATDLQENPRTPSLRIRSYNPINNTLADTAACLRITMGKKDRSAIHDLMIETAPGVSSPPLPGFGRTARKAQLPQQGGRGERAFWRDLLIERQVLTDSLKPYEPTAHALLNAFDDMVRVDVEQVAAAAADRGIVHAQDGTRLRVAALPPRILYTHASALHPERPVLRRLPTYYSL